MKKFCLKLFAATLTTVLSIGIYQGSLPAIAGLDELIRQDVVNSDLNEVNREADNESSAFTSYIVQQGDTLTAIAGKFGVQLQLLANANKLNNLDMVKTGSVLTVPNTISEHIVQPGETLSGIAQNYNMPLTDLKLNNNLTNENHLISGQTLIIPLRVKNTLSAWTPVPSLPVDKLAWPLIGRVSSSFGMREGRPHEGVDIAANEGVLIHAVQSGKVIFAGPRGTYGLAVIIDHGQGLTSLYGHTSSILVKEGENVREGQIIARVGDTGRSTGPHLHLEIRLNGIPYDPLLCLKRMYA